MNNTPFTYSGEDLEVMADSVRYQAWILSWFRPFIRGRAVEIGAGQGAFAQQVAPWTSHLELVEPDGAMAQQLQSRFADNHGVVVHHQDGESYLAALQEQTVDTLLMVNVLEHIRDDHALLKTITRCLTPGGHLLLFVPALPFLYAPMDAQLGHFRRYDRPALQECLRGCELRPLILRYFDLLGIFSWLLLKITRSTRLNPTLVSIYDRWVVPPAQWVEERINPLLGKNLLLVARKEPLHESVAKNCSNPSASYK